MKRLLTLLLVLFALNVNAQDRDTFTICNNVKVYTEYRAEESSLSVRSNVNFLDDVDLSNIEGVLHAVPVSMYKQHLVLDENFVPSIFTEELLDTLSMRWCNQLFERTPTGLKLDTIYDYGFRLPKEIDSLEQAGHVVIESPWVISSSTLGFFTKTYDTVDVYGLAFYISDDDFEYGVDFKLLPTIKTIVKCNNCFDYNRYGLLNNFKILLDNKTLRARQLTLEGSTWIIEGVLVPEWQDVDLTKYKEFIFIEKPK